MDLKNFTKQALIDIVQGANEANEEFLRNDKAIIESTFCNSGMTSANIVRVEFDVAVTTTENNKSEGGGKLNVANLISVGGGLESSNSNQSVSRIKYSIPVTLTLIDECKNLK